MTTRNVVHASFTITRSWPHPPAKVFRAFADRQAKDKWFGGGPDWTQLKAPPPRLICTNFTADQVGGTYYNCSETWEFKYIDSSHVG